MGNNTSAASERQPSLPAGRSRDASAGVPNGREREAPGTFADGNKVAAARYLAPQSTPQSRIVVDIRSANLDRDYNVYIKQEPQRDVDIASVWSGLQALGGLFITVLTIQKLWEDIRFIRLLRRELSTFVGSLTDGGGGADGNGGDGGGISRGPTRPQSASGPPASGSTSAPLAPAATSPRKLDDCLAELGEMLGAERGRGSAAAAGRATGAPTAAAPVAASSASGQGQQQSTAEGAAAAAVATRKETTWSSISGLMEVKILLQEATVLPTLRPDLFQGIRQPPRALLLFGPPGTGKTLLARAVATESRATFLPVTGSSVLSMWYGQSEQNVKALFEKARKRQPAIIFIDEVDSLLGKRSSGGRTDSTPDKRVTNEFLAFIDGIQTQQAGSGNVGDSGGDNRIVVIAATNTPWDLDEAALSRFSRRIYVPLPDRATREALMRRALSGVAFDVSDADWQRLAERADKYSGRDLVQVCREAAMRPLRELWGKRLLEGSSDPSGGEANPATLQVAAAVQQRLVELVANSLAGCVGAGGGGGGRHEQQPQPGKCRARPSAGGGGGEAAPAEAAGPRASAGGALAEGAAAAAARAARGRGPGWAPWSRLRLGGFRLGGDRYTQSRKHARRELERWKRRHGASWCDVDAVLHQAERLLEERLRRAGQGTGQGQGQQEQHQQQGQQAAGSSAASGAGATATAAAAGAAGLTGAAGDVTGPEEQVTVRLRVRVKEGGAAAAAAAAAAGGEQSLEVALEVVVPEPAQPGRESSTPGDSAAATGPSTSTPGHGAGAAGPAGTSSAAAAARSSRADAGASGSGAPAALSLDALLTLPVDRVRPVAVGDLEAALAVISCTEMDQSMKYTEWDEQYGSGAAESGGRHGGSARGRGSWMSMYA